MRLLNRTVLPFLLVGVLAACGELTAPEPLTGKYRLVSANGAALPVNWSETTESTFDIRHGQMDFRPEGVYSQIFQTHETTKETGHTSRLAKFVTINGTASQSGRRVTFTSIDYGPAPYTGTIEGTQLTVEMKAENGRTLVLVYEKDPAA